MVRHLQFKIALLFITPLAVVTNSLGQILNGGFESGLLEPWFQGGNYSNPIEGPENWNVASIYAHTGSFAATDIGNIELRQNFVPISISQILELSLWVRQPFGPALSGVYFHYSDPNYVDLKGPFIPLNIHTDEWEFFDLTNRLTPGASLNGISIFGFSYGTSGTIGRTVVDDVSIVLIPEPSGAALIIGSLVGFLLVVRVHRIRKSAAGLGATN